MRRLALALPLLFSPRAASAHPDGMAWYSGAEEMTCNVCHFGGVEPLVEIVGPTDVAPGTRSTYVVRVSGGQSDGAGYNLEATEGALALPDGDLRSRLLDGQVTHRIPSMDADLHEWTFDWTAPAFSTDVAFHAAGNSVFVDGSPQGDRAGTTTLEVHVTGGPCPDRDADGFEDAACNADADAGGGDCRDTAPRIHPDAAEACDGLDDDCDGAPDDACANDGSYGTGTQPGDLLHALESPERCAACHASYGDEAPYDTWAASLMANGARDPLFLAALSTADQDRPGASDFCIRCHAPGAWLAGASGPADVGAPQDSGEQGVTCGFCHRAVPATEIDANAPYIGNARYFLSDGFTQYGPYEGSPAPHSNAYGEYQTSSDLCGACHDVTNGNVEQVDPDTGEGLGRSFPLERTYSEWRASAFAARGETCQSCHMPRVAGRAASHRDAPERDDVAKHDFAGSNAWILDAARVAGGGSNATLTAGAAAARAKLREAATIEIVDAPESAAPGEEIGLTVRVTNRSGHRLPTGHLEGRRVWIQASAAPVDGEAFFTSGAYDDAEALLQRDPQLRTYEARIGVRGEGETFRLALANYFVEDTRLPPEGFEPTPDLEPIGRDYSDGAGGVRNWDEVTYRFTVPSDAEDEIAFDVRLLYQIATREYVEFLQTENVTDARGDELVAVWNETGRSPPEEIAAATIRIPVAPTKVAETEGCGCRSGGGPAASLSLAVLLAAALPRRRRPSMPRCGVAS